MKRLFVMFLVFSCIGCLFGCSSKQVSKSPLLLDATVKSVVVTSMPEGYYYAHQGAEAKAIAGYIAQLALEDNFEEDPDVYTGMTWVISLEYETGETQTLYHFANMFIKTENGPWYKMDDKQAGQFYTLLSQLND